MECCFLFLQFIAVDAVQVPFGALEDFQRLFEAVVGFAAVDVVAGLGLDGVGGVGGVLDRAP